MKTKGSLKILVGVVLSGLLGACAITEPPVPSSGKGSSSGSGNASTLAEADSAKAQGNSSGEVAEDAAGAIACEASAESPAPLTTPENRPVFEKFNFQPEKIAADSSGSVVVETPYYTFSRCEGKDWEIAAAESKSDAEDAFDYEQQLAEMNDPDYSTLEVDGRQYQYRIRLEAQWLTEALAPDTQPAELVEPLPEGQIVPNDTADDAADDAVIFELKPPGGELISEQLYTLSELQEASLGASLGEPSIAGAVVTGMDDDDGDQANIWFAATTSQGEGDNGFASLIQYDAQSKKLTVTKPEDLQGDQITSIAVTGSALNEEAENANPLTLWLGTKRSGEGNPYFPASGLVAYQPSGETLTNYTITNSSMVGAIPYQLAVAGDSLWVGTGNGVCEVQWQAVGDAKSWDCWRFTATATLPSDGLDVYPSFLATEPAAKLTAKEVEVLWATQTYPEEGIDAGNPATVRYEVAYEKGLEAELSQGGYRVADEVARRAVGGEPIFWPGRQWHWGGDRFSRGLDEVSLNLVGGGPYGLVSSSARSGFDFDHRAIRGEFDLLSLTADSTKVRYYSGWVEGEALTVTPAIMVAEIPETFKPNPLTEIAKTLTEPQGP
ncbi:MAG: hypothetical protein AAGC93_20480 [Cyanobacteria bacterium P01_F01_bin.53]